MRMELCGEGVESGDLPLKYVIEDIIYMRISTEEVLKANI